MATSQLSAQEIALTNSGSTNTDGLRPGHDIFCTPENDSFDKANAYTELNPEKHEIRLVRLLPTSANEILQCELLPPQILQEVKGKYTAPSYCAGDAKNTKSIILNGSSFNVFANLEHALREVQNFWLKTFGDRECLLWIEQISINQGNINERSHQVRFMREIYQNAEQVLVCLSTSETRSEGLKWCLELITAVTSQPGEDWWKSSDGSITSYENHVYLGRRWAEVISDNFANGWLAFYDLVEAQWWSRAWVFQEFMVAPKVYFMQKGTFALFDDTLVLTWRSLLYWHDSKLLFAAGSRMQMLDLHYHCDGTSEECGNLRCLMDRACSNSTGAAVKTFENMIKTKDAWRGSMRLIELLRLSRLCSATDPRDNIFAFLGVSQSTHGIVPDYTHTFAQVLLETTIMFIKGQNSLDILYHAAMAEVERPKGSTIPSWVVD